LKAPKGLNAEGYFKRLDLSDQGRLKKKFQKG